MLLVSVVDCVYHLFYSYCGGFVIANWCFNA